ncbi:hypothetical protein LJR234_000097 [Mesorhizobium amorphae]|uniref:hypothetical protein n=1 Tax=Mesorhizobium amorphae TaxID=71433 RepID=UPI003ED0989C
MTRVGAFDAVPKGCSIPSTLMIFAVRVVLFGRGVQNHGEQAAVVILGPGRIDRGAKKERLWFRREVVDARAFPYVEDRPCTSITSMAALSASLKRRMTTSSAINAGACESRHGRRRLRRRDVADIPPLAYLGPIKGFLISAFYLAMLVVNARAALMAIVSASVSMFDEMDLLDRRRTVEQVVQQGRSHVPSN